MSPLEQFRELEKLPGAKVYPVATFRYGYAAFVAHVVKVEHADRPSDWYVGELDRNNEIVAVKKICDGPIV